MKLKLTKMGGIGTLCLFLILSCNVIFAKPTAYYENANDDNFTKGTTRYIDDTLSIANPQATKWFNRQYYDDKVNSGSNMNYKRNRYKLTVNRGSRKCSAVSGGGHISTDKRMC